MNDLISQTCMKAVQERLLQLSTKFKTIRLVSLASVDGFALASSGHRAGDDETPERFSAMASSMVALAHAAGREFGSTDFEVALLDFHNIYLAFRSVNTPSASFVLAAAVENPANLSTFSKGLRDCAKAIETILADEANADKN